MLQGSKIRKQRTIGGHPETNGLVERQNGKLKMLIAKNREIHGGTWYGKGGRILEMSTKAYNNQYNRGTRYAPNEAVRFTSKEKQSEVRQNVKLAYPTPAPKLLNVDKYAEGDTVRVRIAKGKLDKASTPNWTDRLYKITKVVPRSGSIAAKYKLEGKPEDLSYSRNDLLRVNPDTIESIPNDRRADTRLKVLEDKEEEGIGSRVSLRAQRTGGAPQKKVDLRPRRKTVRKRKNDEPVYVIERFLKAKGGGKNRQFLVRWKGYSDDEATWERESKLLKDLTKAEFTGLVVDMEL